MGVFSHVIRPFPRKMAVSFVWRTTSPHFLRPWRESIQTMEIRLLPLNSLADEITLRNWFIDISYTTTHPILI